MNDSEKDIAFWSSFWAFSNWLTAIAEFCSSLTASIASVNTEDILTKSMVERFNKVPPDRI